MHKFLNGPLIDAERYLALSLSEKKLLQRRSPSYPQIAAQETLPVAERFKYFLDRKFGKGMYTFVSIGRSPVMVGRGLEGMGVEAKYVPISGLHKIYHERQAITRSFLDINLDTYIEFIKAIGLDAQSVQKAGKKLVFYDYTSSGNTLKEMKKFFRKRMGLPLFKCEFRSINNDLENMCGIGKLGRIVRTIKDLLSLITDGAIFDRNYTTTEDYITNYWLNSQSAKFSHIPQLNFWQANRIFEITENFKPDKNARFFNFNILNLLEKAGLLVQK